MSGLDRLLVPGDGDDPLIAALGRLLDGDHGPGLGSDLPDPLPPRTNDGPRHVIGDRNLGALGRLAAQATSVAAKIQIGAVVVSSVTSEVAASKALIHAASSKISTAPAKASSPAPSSKTSSSVHVVAKITEVTSMSSSKMSTEASPAPSPASESALHRRATASSPSSEHSSPTSVSKATSRPPSSTASASPTASSAHVLASVASVFVGVERIKVDGVVAADRALDISVEHHVKDVGEGGRHLIQVSCHLHTPVSRLGRTVGVNLNIGPSVLSNLLDLGPALSDDAAHDALMDE